MRSNRLMKGKRKIYRNKMISLSSIILFSLCFIFSSFESEASAVYYHKHSTTSTTETTTDYNDSINTATISNVYGGCYTEAVYHWHSGSCPKSECHGHWTVRMPIHINDDGQESENYACDGGCGSWGGPNDYGRYCGNLTYSCGYTNGQLCGYKATGCSKSNA